jgi:hypothetical protein
MKKLLALLPFVLIAGCTGQQTAAGLIAIVGTSVETLITTEGSAVPAQLPADLAAAENAVKNWTAGTPTQDVVQALNLLVSDINLIPVAAQDKAYIVLAVDTTEQVIQLFQPAATANVVGIHTKVKLSSKTPVSDYKAKWNSIQQGSKPILK